MTPTAFYLVKPDGLAHPQVLARARELTNELKVVAEREIVLTGQQVSALWAENRATIRPIASAFLGLYLVGHTSRLVTVRGANALPTVIALKRQLRREFGQGAFANVVHAPSDPIENDDHAAILGGARPNPAHSSPTYRNPPASARVVALGAEVADTVSAIWRHVRRHGWASLASTPSTQPGQAWLIADDRHSIDSAVSALWEAFPTLQLRTAIEVVCEAERTGRALVATGSPSEMERLVRRLRAHELDADMVIFRSGHDPNSASAPVGSRHL